MTKELMEDFEEITGPQEEAAEELTQGDVLEMLLGAASPREITTEVYIKRIGASFTIRALTYEQYTRMENQCKKIVKNKRNGRLTKETDEEKLSLMMIVESCVNPNFNDPRVRKQLTEKYKVADVYDAIQKILLLGEITQISSAILDVSGFEDDYEEIKN